MRSLPLIAEAVKFTIADVINIEALEGGPSIPYPLSIMKNIP